ncbi:MAG TPA: phosphatase PAP2 family protein [Chryseolinea sp.]
MRQFIISKRLHFGSDKEYNFVYSSFGVIHVLFTTLSLSMAPLDGVFWVNGLNTEFLDFVFQRITYFGNGVFMIPFLVILYLRKIYLSIALATSGLVQGCVVILFKQILFPFSDRPITKIKAGAAHLIPGLNIHHSNSFPSGHAVTVFGFCIFLALCYKNKLLTCMLLLLATLVGISRVYLLQHYLMDVAVGALIGSLTSVVVFHVFEKVNKPSWMTTAPRFKLHLPLNHE